MFVTWFDKGFSHSTPATVCVKFEDQEIRNFIYEFIDTLKSLCEKYVKAVEDFIVITFSQSGDPYATQLDWTVKIGDNILCFVGLEDGKESLEEIIMNMINRLATLLNKEIEIREENYEEEIRKYLSEEEYEDIIMTRMTMLYKVIEKSK